MKLKIGDKIRLKPYNQVVEMYKKGKFNNLMRPYPTNSEFIYGIYWIDYYKMCQFTGEIIEINQLDYVVRHLMNDSEFEFDIPPILIQNGHGINLPDNLFEL